MIGFEKVLISAAAKELDKKMNRSPAKPVQYQDKRRTLMGYSLSVKVSSVKENSHLPY